MNQCQKIQQQLLDRFGKQNITNSGDQTGSRDLTDHLRQCDACRLYWRNLEITGDRLNDFRTAVDAGVSVPGISYFESLVTETVAKRPVKSGYPLKREVSAFISLGILIVTGAVFAVGYGYWLPVAIISGLISMQAPLLILLWEQEREGFIHET